MKKKTEETIFALSTPYGQSAIAVVRISGNMSKMIAKSICQINKIEPRKATFTKFYDKQKKIIDSGIMIFFNSPFSFTGEDMLEFQCHGAISIINKMLLELSLIENCRYASPGEFSRRAFANKKNDLIHYEGLANLIASETENQRIIATKQSFGESENIYRTWRESLLESIALLDAAIDFSDENETFGLKKVEKLLNEVVKKAANTIELAKNNQEILFGTKVLIFGPPNSGKSSLFNLLSREDRAITSDEAGTTTDQNSNVLEISGIRTVITDTAGLRNASRNVEKIGVEKTQESIKQRNKFILVLSPDCFSDENCKLIESTLKNINTKKTIVIFNKNDLPDFQAGKNLWISKIKQLKKLKNISISCTLDIKNVNILVELNNFISKNLLTIDTLGNDDYFFSEKRQIDIVQKIIAHIKDALTSLDDLEISVNYLDQAVKLLDELFGKNNYEDRLGYIFDRFCIGK